MKQFKGKRNFIQTEKKFIKVSLKIRIKNVYSKIEKARQKGNEKYYKELIYIAKLMDKVCSLMYSLTKVRNFFDCVGLR